jgi:hypothetical protein
MTQLDLADAPLESITLGLEQRVTLGAAVQAPSEQDDRISLGRPACVALDVGTVDEAAQIFLQGRPESTFWLLALTCSFRAVDDEPIEKAWIEVQLETVEPPGSEAPTAWSMEPLSLSNPMQISQVTKLDGSLKLTSTLVPIEVGPSVGREKTVEFETLAPFVEAHREGTPRPAWIFSRTKVTDVRGVHRLRTVVDLPAGTSGRAEISAGASLRLKRLGLIPYRAKLDQLPDHRVAELNA